MKLLFLLRRMALLVPLLGFSLLAQASHFRYGSLSYQTAGANDRVVSFRLNEAFREDYFGTPPAVGATVDTGERLYFGDGSSAEIILTITAIGDDYFFGELNTTHTYATSGNVTAYTTDCCRISNLQNNADNYWYVSTVVGVGASNDSPVSSLAPIVNLPTNRAVASYTLPAADPNGNALTYSVATAADLGGIAFTNAPGLAVNPTTGVVTFNTVGKAVGNLYNAVIKVSDGSTSIIVDHLIQIVNQVSVAPVFVYPPTPANGQVFTVTPGTLVTFGVRATDADAGDVVTLSGQGLPVGATFVPATGNPVQSTFSWTPTAANLGTTVVTFLAQDNSGVQALTSVTIQVQPVCNAVTNVVATPLSSTTASVAFTAGTGATAYTVTYTPSGGAAQTLAATASPATLTGLLPSTTYSVTVTSQCAAGQTAVSAAVSFTTQPAPATANVSVLYQTGDLGQPTDNQLRPFLQLVNTGTTAVPYASLTVRYWLTVENFRGQLVTLIDWAKLGTSFVSAHYVALATPRQGALGYIEYGFAAGAGSLAAGTDSGPIYGKAYKPDYTNFDETNDWSYQTSSSFTTNPHVTLYQNGTLIAGTEPPAVAATTSIKVYAGNQDTSPTTSYLNLTLRVGNVGNLPVNYADLTVRYYFTRDGATTLVPTVDYAKLGASNISVRYVPLATPLNGADGYLEFGFSAALGVFYPLTDTDNILVKLRKGDYTAFTQTNDYSFGSSVVVEQPRIPAYLNGQLVFGTEPTSASLVASRTATSPAQGASASAAAVSGSQLPEKIAGSPNPFTDNVRLSFTLPQTEAYTLAVYDGQGRLLEQLPGGTAGAGEPQQLEWAASRYAAGLYMVRLVTPSSSQQFRLIKQ